MPVPEYRYAYDAHTTTDGKNHTWIAHTVYIYNLWTKDVITIAF